MRLGALKPRWLLRRRAGALLAKADRDPSAANLDALERWRREDSRHASALSSGQAVLRQSARLSATDSTESGPTAPPPASNSNARQFAAAASLGLGVIGIASFLAWQQQQQPLEAVLLATRVGEIRRVPLVDGSNLTLDTGTSVRVEIGRNNRRAVLDGGRARFAIASTQAPFTIRTGTASITVEAGVIDVSSYGRGAEIEVLAGHARISQLGKQPPQRLTVDAPASISMFGGAVRAVPGSKSSDWPSGRLSFTRARLGDVIAAADRYTTTKIIIGDPSIAGLRVTGVFKTGDAEGLSNSLSAALGLRIERRGGRNIILMSDRRPR